MTDQGCPPGISGHGKVVLFDGQCVLCNGSVRFLIRHDRRRRLRFVAAQSEKGQAILAFFDYPTDRFSTVLLVEGSRLYTRSTAFMRLMAGLPWPWKVVSAFWLVPRPLRDVGYNFIARHRYRWFGRYDQCRLPEADHADRYL